MVNIACEIILVFFISCALGFLARYFYYKANYHKFKLETNSIRYSTSSLIPWIEQAIEKSADKVYQEYILRSQAGLIKKELSRDEYDNFINDVRSQFYGSIPENLLNTILKYIDLRQLEIMILSSFKYTNIKYDFYFKLNNEENFSAAE